MHEIPWKGKVIRMNKMTVAVLAAVVLGAASLLWVTLGGDPVPGKTSERTRKSLIRDAAGNGGSAKKSSTKKVSARQPGTKREESRAKDKAAFRRASVVDNYSPADRKLADAVQSALDDDNFERTRKAVAKAMESENPDVRQEAVNALGWFGDKALVELTRAMADKNADVAELARSHVENTLMGMEDDDRAVVLAGEYVNLFAEDEEAVTMFAGVLSAAGTRITDPDDASSAEDVAKAKGNRAGIVDIVDEMIGKGGKLAEKGRELYEEIVGEEWTDRATADKWANDIEEPQQEESEQEEADSESAGSPEN